LRALTYLARKLDLKLPILDHILESNRMLIDRGVEWILNQSGKRIAFLGISFKAGTDDVRESSFIEVIERLIGKGREVRIFDPNVKIAHLVGTNRSYLIQALPHIANLMVLDVMDAIDWAETIVTTVPDAAYERGIANVRADQTLLHFTRFNPSDRQLRQEGFLW
jgi:GDP-mannose 6-dehydrogenase